MKMYIFKSDEQKRIEELEALTKSADQKYKELDLTSVTIEEVKEAKIAQLKELCTLAIFNGFVSTVTDVNGVPYEFGFKTHDQDNFDMQSGRINSWYTRLNQGKMTQEEFDAKFPLKWKSKSHGVIQLTEDEFYQVTSDGEIHLWTQQDKYWQLETQVLQAFEAGDKNAIDAIVW